MKSPIAVVVLAAGAGTRMKSALPKVLHPLAGWPMVRHVLENAARLKPARIVGVVAPGAKDVARAFAPHPAVTQHEPRGTADAAKAALPALKAAGKATIVNVASGAGLQPRANFSHYCASKGGVVLFTKALAMDLAADRIRVNAVCPGIVMTPMVERNLALAGEREAAYQRYISRNLMKRFGAAEEIAEAVLWLSSDESSFVTGSALSVDGGSVFH